MAVADNGVGMAPQQIPVALEPFGQVDGSLSRSHEGTGLGLPLCQRFAEAHGGRLAIESALGKGTTVTGRLPVGRLLMTQAAWLPAAREEAHERRVGDGGGRTGRA